MFFFTIFIAESFTSLGQNRSNLFDRHVTGLVHVVGLERAQNLLARVLALQMQMQYAQELGEIDVATAGLFFMLLVVVAQLVRRGLHVQRAHDEAELFGRGHEAIVSVQHETLLITFFLKKKRLLNIQLNRLF